MVYFTLRRHKKLNEQERNEYVEFYNQLNDKNKSKVIKRAKLIRVVATISTAFLALVMLAIFIGSLFIGGHWAIPVIMFAIAFYFGYEFYCTITWYKIEDFEFVRLVEMLWVQKLINEQQLQSVDIENLD